jgi:trehalose synthase
LTGARILPEQTETVLESLTKASIRAAFIAEGRRPEVADFAARAAATQGGMLELVRQLHGIDPARPLFTQISRFDRFKDPVGTVTAFVRAYLRLLREGVALEERPQFVYAGNLIEEDPQTVEELLRIFIFLDHLRSEIKDELGDFSAAQAEEVICQLRRDIFILILPMHDEVANALEVNAFQRTSRAVVQKSIQEGFGLVVAEAMWKGVPVIGGNTGGIRLQIDHGTNGFLAGQVVDGELRDSVEDAAEYMVTYAKYPDVAARMGESARQKVAKEFLMPVNLNLWLQKIGDLMVAEKINLNAAPKTTRRIGKRSGKTGPSSTGA